MTGQTVQFFFGIGSRYSYLAATQLKALSKATGAAFQWRVVFSPDLVARAGHDPFAADNKRGQYLPAYRTRDALRWAALYGIPYADPEWEKVDWWRLALACAAAERLSAAEAFAGPLFARCFSGLSKAPNTDAELVSLAETAGCNPTTFAAYLDSAETKQHHERNMTEALSAGVFGVPSFITSDSQLFFGQDRLVLLRRHLESLT